MPGRIVRAGSLLAFLLLCALAYAPLVSAGFTGPDLRALSDATAALQGGGGLEGLARRLHEIEGLEGHALPAVSLLASTGLWADGGCWNGVAAWPLRLESLLLLIGAAVASGAFLRRLLLPWIGREPARSAGAAAALLTALAPTSVAAVVRVPARRGSISFATLTRS